MALIKIDLTKAQVSISAAKKQGFLVYYGSGDYQLVIDSDHKATVSKVMTDTDRARKLGLACAKAGKSINSAKLKLRSAHTPEAKTKIREQIKALTHTAKTSGAEAKEILKAAVAALKKAGLSGLSPMILPSYITVGDWRYTEAKLSGSDKGLIRLTKVVQLRKWKFKPKFASAAKIESLRAAALKDQKKRQG